MRLAVVWDVGAKAQIRKKKKDDGISLHYKMLPLKLVQ